MEVLMVKRKNDCRSERTRQNIKKSLLEILTQKDLNEIAIKEISADAGINRVTFYNYYDDIYALYNDVENDIFNHFTDALTNNSIVTYEDFYGSIVDFLLEDRNRGKMILQSINRNGVLILKIRDFFVDGCFRIWKEERGLSNPDDRMKLLAHYRVLGVTGLLLQWIASDYKMSASEIKKMISSLDEKVDF